MRKSLIALVFLFTCPFLLAQQAMNNASVVKLVKAGLSDDLIVSTINASPGTYDTSADGLIALKTAGASDKVVAAIVMKASAPAGRVRPPYQGEDAQASAVADPNDPNVAHDPGIYMYTKGPNGMELTMLESSVYTAGKTGGMFASALTYGIAKMKIKAVIQGSRSNVQTNDTGVLFYFYFEEEGRNPSVDLRRQSIHPP